MAVHQFNPNTKHEAVLVPFQYIESTGAEADHTHVIADKAVDERGNPKTEYALVWKRENRLFYEDGADFTSLTADEQSRALWVPTPAVLDRLVTKGALTVR